MSIETLIASSGLQCTIQTKAAGTDDWGADNGAWQNDQTSVPYWLQADNVSEEKTDRQAAILRFTIFLGPDVTITEQNRILISSTAYDVVGVRPRYRPGGVAFYSVVLERVR